MFLNNLIVEKMEDVEGYWVCPDLKKIGRWQSEDEAKAFLEKVLFETFKRKEKELD